MPAAKKYESAAQRQAAYRARRKELGQSPQCSVTGSVYRRWEKMRKQALSLLKEVVCEMETYHARRSEPWQDSLRGEAFTELMESVADIVEALRETPVGGSEA